jgi:peptidoglycan/xylan/chitin deacetylase (PgdA/CDA1 family)
VTLVRSFFSTFFIGSIIFVLSACQPAKVHVFPNLEGPDTLTPVPVIGPTSYKNYEQGSPSRLAVLLTDENSNWLGLAHGLKTIGVPFLITTDYEAALQHDVVLVYPIISGKLLSSDALKALADYPRQGGTLMAVNVLGGGMNSIFGFEDVVETKNHHRLNFNEGYSLTEDFKSLYQHSIKVGSETNSTRNPGLNSYANPENLPIAVYEDGSAAITFKAHGDGRAYAIGIDIGQILLKGYNFREEDIAEYYVNHYQPSLDALLRFIMKVYQEGEDESVILGTVPEGKSLSVMMTHDVDYTKSLKNALSYAQFEAEQDIRATYFVQTKYIEDYNDSIFLNDDGAKYLRQLDDMGADLQSHSVSHSLQFHEFDMGTGEERYPDYAPYVYSSERTRKASLLGELRVSKFLLENFKQKGEVTAFRPGYLRNPPQLSQALQATGYRYSSAVTANKSLTHLPFQLNADRGFEAETQIFEFPVTIEDEKLPKMGDRLDEAIILADILKKYGGIFVVLNHPDILDHKLDFEKGFIEHVKPFAWIGSLPEFGAWWAARNDVQIDVTSDEQQKTIHLKPSHPIKGLSLTLPRGYVPLNSSEAYEISNGQLLIKQLEDSLAIELESAQIADKITNE